jgi:CO/xanthine dehydrogenase FAD-binding subunit
MIVTSVSFDRRALQGFRFLKASRVKPKGAAILSIAAVIEENNGIVARARIAFGAMAETPIRATALEAALHGQPLTPQTLERAAPTALEGVSPASDAVASEWHRRAVLPVHLSRLLLPH